MKSAISHETKGFLSIITAMLCVAIILTLSGCASIPADSVKHAIEKRLPRAQEATPAACPSPVNITIISNGVPE